MPDSPRILDAVQALTRRFGRWLCRHDLEPVRAYFEFLASSHPVVDRTDEAIIANALAMLRIIDGHDPADATK